MQNNDYYATSKYYYKCALVFDICSMEDVYDIDTIIFYAYNCYYNYIFHVLSSFCSIADIAYKRLSVIMDSNYCKCLDPDLVTYLRGASRYMEYKLDNLESFGDMDVVYKDAIMTNLHHLMGVKNNFEFDEETDMLICGGVYIDDDFHYNCVSTRKEEL